MNLVLDGCSTACARKTLERYDLSCTSVVLTDFGVEKGTTTIDESVIARVTEAIASAHLTTVPEA